jgi:methionine-rich copper-binding protein CopC
MARGWGRVASRLGPWPDALAGVAVLVIVVALAVLALVAGTAPAGAHAQLVGSTPEDGSAVRVAPDEVSIVLDAKPATVEGDPLQVYDSGGRRVDAADARTDRRGRTLTISLDHQLELPAGEYQIAYRLVSADSHVIAGRLSFSARSAAPPERGGRSDGPQVGTVWTPDGEAAAADAPASPDDRLARDGPDDPRPRLVAAGAAVLALLVLVLRVIRWAAPDRPARVPARWADTPSGSSPVRHHRSGSGWDRPRPRSGRRSTPAGAGLRLPRQGSDGAPAVPAGVARTRARPRRWATPPERSVPGAVRSAVGPDHPEPGWDRPRRRSNRPTYSPDSSTPDRWDRPTSGGDRPRPGWPTPGPPRAAVGRDRPVDGRDREATPAASGSQVRALQSRTVAQARTAPSPRYRGRPDERTWR